MKLIVAASVSVPLTAAIYSLWLLDEAQRHLRRVRSVM